MLMPDAAISVVDLRITVDKIIKATVELYQEMSVPGHELMTNLHGYFDTMINSDTGHWFGEAKLKGEQSRGANSILLHLSQGGGSLDPSRCNNWIQKADVVARYIAVLIHVTAGQPPRGPELTACLVRNAPMSCRNVFWNKGTVMLVLGQSKTRVAAGHDFHVARFLPGVVAEILLKYIAFVRPIYAGLLRSLNNVTVHEGRLLIYRFDLDPTDLQVPPCSAQ